jgi:hypothetical protein
VALVRDAVSARPVRCRIERLEPGAPGIYACTAGRNADPGAGSGPGPGPDPGPRRLRVEWQHYGTGAYTIRALPGGRVVARGTLSISQ